MKHVEGLEGKKVCLTKPAYWRNYGDARAREVFAGTHLELVSYRPEGYRARNTATGEHFFLFARYLENAVELKELTHDDIETIIGELLNVWDFCGSECYFWLEKRFEYEISEAQRFNITEEAHKRWNESSK